MTGQSLTTLTLADLAAAINDEHVAAESAAAEAIHRARHAGELLLQAKAQLQHGQWLPWLTANCTVGARQAQRYIRLTQNWDTLLNTTSTSHLGIDAALRMLAAPTDNAEIAQDRDAALIECLRLLKSRLSIVELLAWPDYLLQDELEHQCRISEEIHKLLVEHKPSRIETTEDAQRRAERMRLIDVIMHKAAVLEVEVDRFLNDPDKFISNVL
jgi:Protein of unknown function (DUF3102)